MKIRRITMVKFKSDCRHFRGDVPCRQHKQYGVHCSDCGYYDKTEQKILIIKMGAIGDVIRTTPLLHRIRREMPGAAVWWLTYSPDVVPSTVDKIMPFNLESIVTLNATKFDILINLDKDKYACGMAATIPADRKYGFTLENGTPAPVNELASAKFLTGLFDDVNQANEKSYLEEIFEICGWKFEGEEYILDCDESLSPELNNDGKKVVGLNTGCGARWVSRLWADEKWLELIKKLQDDGCHTLLLGGAQEDEKNRMFAEKTGAEYPGYFPLDRFISLVNKCDLVVSAVTMGMHIAIGLKKKLILMNNIFNPKEFELYGRGEIVSPDKPCTCFFSPKCKNPDYFCMDSLGVDKIYNSIKRNL